MATKNLVLFGVIVFIATNMNVAFTTAQDVKATLFKEAKPALQQAKQAKADILAPKSFNKGMEHYREAEEDLKKGENLEDIRKKLRAAVAYFTKAAEATKLAEVTFISSMKARSDARSVQAPGFASELWQKAEEKFAEAATELENGDVKDAKKKSAEAEKIFRRAELDAIKVAYLNETWQLLEQADRTDIKDRAPKTLARAQSLIKRAEKELTENRYDTDVARNLAKQARDEAKHAIYLSNAIRNYKTMIVNLKT
ncbi:MAG: hypothetical protein ACE5IR_09970 [bacterium]